MSANDPKRTLISDVSTRCLVDRTSTSASISNDGKAYGLGTGTPDLGADGKDYRANFVHAPFPEILSSRALSEPQDSRLQPAKHRLRAM